MPTADPAAASPAPTPPARRRSSRAPRAAARPRPIDGSPAGEVTEHADEPRLDRRRTHVVDRAADYAELAARGMSVAQIARRRRRSKSYVSIVLRLGQALATMEPAERAAMRSPRITWTLAQRLVRRETDAASLHAQLRYALGGFSTHNVDGRVQRHGRPAAPPRPVGVAWGWDADWFARDPAGYAASHLAHVVSLTSAVATRARRATQLQADTRLDAGQSLRLLQRRLAAARVGPPATVSAEERRALAAFAVLERKLAEAADEIAALPADGATASAPGRAPRRPIPAPSPADAHDLAMALEAELDDA